MLKKITNRLEKLEETFGPPSEEEDRWGPMAKYRDELLRLAEERGEPIDDLKRELEAAGPARLWCDVARGYLEDHGIVQGSNESLAQVFARSLEIDTDALKVCMAQNRLSSELQKKFGATRDHLAHFIKNGCRKLAIVPRVGTERIVLSGRGALCDQFLSTVRLRFAGSGNVAAPITGIDSDFVYPLL
jgi:hypothetical protein